MVHLTDGMHMDWTTLGGEIRRNWKRYVSPVMLVLGVALLGYVASEYYGMHREQQRLRAEWDQQQKTRAAAQADASQKPVDDGLIKLEIPKIELSAIVVDGTTRKQLK